MLASTAEGTTMAHEAPRGATLSQEEAETPSAVQATDKGAAPTAPLFPTHRQCRGQRANPQHCSRAPAPRALARGAMPAGTPIHFVRVSWCCRDDFGFDCGGREPMGPPLSQEPSLGEPRQVERTLDGLWA